MEGEFERAVHAAENAHERQDWLGALGFWKESVRLNPTFAAGYWMGGALSLMFGRLEDAEDLLSKGVTLDPGNVSMAVEHARAATLLKNWPEAIRRWNALSRRAPDAKEVIEGRAEAEMQIQMYRMGSSGEVRDRDWRRFEAGKVSSSDTDLFMEFQSLGDNCEFGLIQRHFLAEPVSLLRWSAISTESLIGGIEDGFEAVGAPETTVLTVGANNEYYLHDATYNIFMHTFLKVHLVSESPADLHNRMCQRQSYLGRKLREDLEDPDQIFVYKPDFGATVDDAKTLHSALERRAPNYLLFAVEADAERPAGSVEQIAPRLFVGAIGHLSRPGDGWENLDFESWRSVCADVLQRVRRAQGAPGLLKRAFHKLLR